MLDKVAGEMRQWAFRPVLRRASPPISTGSSQPFPSLVFHLRLAESSCSVEMSGTLRYGDPCLLGDGGGRVFHMGGEASNTGWAWRVVS